MIWIVSTITILAHIHSYLWVAPASAGAVHHGRNDLLQIFRQHQSVDLLDDRVSRPNEQCSLQSVD